MSSSQELIAGNYHFKRVYANDTGLASFSLWAH